METYKIICEECGGSMNVDENMDIIYCPFCGSNRIIKYSDDIVKTKINANKDVKIFKEKKNTKRINFAKEQEEITKRDKESNVHDIVFLIVLTICYLLIYAFILSL